MSATVNDRLQRGDIVVVGDAMYRKCLDCQQIVRINKPVLGALHFCLSEEDRAAISRERHAPGPPPEDATP